MPAVVEETNTNNSNSNADGNSPTDKSTTERNDRNEQMWKVLKAHILRERARKKQEREAEVEEERLRKERETREQQDVMTLAETREQIAQLEAKLQQFKEEKHQLFLQLKKVLNEDDNRRRQLVKESSEQMIANVLHQQTLYIQPPQNPTRIQTISQQQTQQAPQQPQVTYKTTIKRPRSPSPQPQVPVTIYHQGYTTYKPPTVGTTYQGSPQKDDGRRNELVRAVLWNKAQQYSSQPSAFYPVAPQELSIYYPLSRETSRNVYENQRPQTFQIEHKLPEHYTTLRTPSTHAHVIHPGSGLAINPGQAQPQPKNDGLLHFQQNGAPPHYMVPVKRWLEEHYPGGSITAGYPVRSQSQYQQGPAPASLYTTQSRQMYQNPGATLNYPPRE